MNDGATKTVEAKPTTGTCSHCGWIGLDLKKDGTVRAHGNEQTGHPRRTCPGNGKAPRAPWTPQE